jgi:hypothetical protein
MFLFKSFDTSAFRFTYPVQRHFVIIVPEKAQLPDHAFIKRRQFEQYLLRFLESSVQVWNAQLRLNCQCRWVAHRVRVEVRKPLVSAHPNGIENGLEVNDTLRRFQDGIALLLVITSLKEANFICGLIQHRSDSP